MKLKCKSILGGYPNLHVLVLGYKTRQVLIRAWAAKYPGAAGEGFHDLPRSLTGPLHLARHARSVAWGRLCVLAVCARAHRRSQP